ncbi:hypothetical protein BC835DRAFT_1307677 [Cytidiella melzeri]|nr:hypothetical protein BC835DRAFT_1307677 [Cytidiella melzeri]
MKHVINKEPDRGMNRALLERGDWKTHNAISNNTGARYGVAAPPKPSSSRSLHYPYTDHLWTLLQPVMDGKPAPDPSTVAKEEQYAKQQELELKEAIKIKEHEDKRRRSVSTYPALL